MANNTAVHSCTMATMPLPSTGENQKSSVVCHKPYTLTNKDSPS